MLWDIPTGERLHTFESHDRGLCVSSFEATSSFPGQTIRRSKSGLPRRVSASRRSQGTNSSLVPCPLILVDAPRQCIVWVCCMSIVLQAWALRHHRFSLALLLLSLLHLHTLHRTRLPPSSSSDLENQVTIFKEVKFRPSHTHGSGV